MGWMCAANLEHILLLGGGLRDTETGTDYS